MMNIIRADLYRIARSKGMYIAFGIVLAISVVLTVVQGMGADTMIVFEGNFLTGTEIEQVAVNGANAAAALISLASLIIMLVIPIFTIVAGPIFQDGTVKNEVSWGISRTKLYAARLVIVGVLSVLLLVTLVGVGTGIATILWGFGDGGLDILASFAALSFMYVAAGWTGVFLVFTIKNGFVVVEVFGGLMIGVGFIAMILGMAGVNVEAMLYFDMMTNVARLANAAQLETRSLLLSLGVGMIWLVVPTVIGLTRFQRAEIK